jgi:hypothetical protein
MSSLTLSWFLAFVLGARHASEPDHLAAVTTLLADAPNARRAATLGAVWGLGHAISLMVMGGLLLLAREQLSPELAAGFELAVSFMLLGLGVRSIARAVELGRTGHHTLHTHGALSHEHPAHEPHLHFASLTLARRPLLIGLMHGLAGSGTLAALALASTPSLSAALVCLALFGVGSVFGMSALSGLIGLPLGRFAQHPQVRIGLIAGTGLISVAVGALWAWPRILQLTGH